MSGRRPPASYWRSPARQPSTNRRPRGPASRPLHYREFTGGVPTLVDGSQAGQDSNLQHTVPKTIVLPIAPPAYMPVCASTHSLDAIRRPGCDGHRPPLRPPANACCATTGWMPWGPVSWVRCPSCPSRPTGGVPCVPSAGLEPAAFRSGGGRPIHWATKAIGHLPPPNPGVGMMVRCSIPLHMHMASQPMTGLLLSCSPRDSNPQPARFELAASTSWARGTNTGHPSGTPHYASQERSNDSASRISMSYSSSICRRYRSCN